jgi:PTS system cellobiose-specific IIB component
MRVLIVCGAGASSTFVALRVRQCAAQRGLDVQASAGSEADLEQSLQRLDGLRADVLLVGPHLSPRYEQIRLQARAAGVSVALLPDTIFEARDGNVALDAALAAAAETFTTPDALQQGSDADLTPDLAPDPAGAPS